jgi:transposase-like protein
MSRSIIFFIENKLSKNLDIFNVGINNNNIQIKDLAKIISKKLKIPYTINNSAADDKRTYRVNFNKIKKIAPNIIKKFKPIEKIVSEIIKFMKSKKFSPNLVQYRLEYLEKNYHKKNIKII